LRRAYAVEPAKIFFLAWQPVEINAFNPSCIRGWTH